MGILDRFNNSIPIENEPIKNEKTIGKIFKLSNEGWGFVTSKDIPFEKIFFHWTALEQDTIRFPKLEEGMEVEFYAVEQEDNKGFRAIKIEVLENKQDND
jgi:cold shock CspA family protein